MANEVRLELSAEDRNLGDTLQDILGELERLKASVGKLGAEDVDFNTGPAEADLERLTKELLRLERAFEASSRALDLARTRNEIKGTESSARQLANAEAELATRGKQLIDFAQRLPAPLRRSAESMNRLEKQTEEAASAFRRFESAARKTRSGFSDLLKAVQGLRAGLAGFLAVLGVQQILSFGRALVRVGQDAVETKIKFDALIPQLRAFTGSTELAQEVANRLGATADKLKTPLGDLVAPFARITAATKETNLSLSEQSDLFESALLTTRAFGLSADETSRLITGFAQVAGKGTLQMEELRQQIGEVAFNALPALARALGTSVPELIERVADRSIDAETALRGFAKGLRDANEAAGLAQIDTLRGDLGGLAREAEKAQQVLADGFEPGLRELIQTTTELLEKNKELVGGLGQLGSTALSGLSEVVEALNFVALGFQRVGEDAVEFGRDLQSIGFEKIGKQYEQFGFALLDTKGKAEEFIDAAITGLRRLANDGASTAEEIQEAFKLSFAAAATEAGVSTEVITAKNKELAERLGQIFERVAEERVRLEKEIQKDIEEFGEVRKETEERVGDALVKILNDSIERRKQLLKDFVEEAKQAEKERAEAARKAAEEIQRYLDAVFKKASANADARIAADQKAADAVRDIEQRLQDYILGLRTEAAKITETSIQEIARLQKEAAAERIAEEEKAALRLKEIEAELQEKLAELREEAAKKLAAKGADRAKITEELLKKIVEAEQDAAEKQRKIQDDIARASEEAALRRIEAERKVREEYEKTVETLTELVKKLKETAAEDEGDGPLAQIADDAREAREEVEALGDELGSIFGDVGQSTDPGEFLSQGFADAEALLGGATAGFGSYTDALEAASESTAEARDFTKQLEEAIAAVKEQIGNFDEITADTLGVVVDSFSEMAEGGRVTAADLEEFGATIERVLSAAGKPALETAGAVGQIGESATKAGEGVQELADSAGEAGESFIELSDGTKILVPTTKEANEGARAAAEGVKMLGEAAKEAGDNLGTAAEAAEKMPDEIVGEEEPGKLRDLGVAAGEAAPALDPAAEALQKLATASSVLAEALPVLTENLPIINGALAQVLETLSSSEVDFGQLAEQVKGIAEPIAALSLALPVVQQVVAALPESILKLQEAAEPVFELLQQVGEDGRVQKIAEALTTIGGVLPLLPEPLEKLRESLAGIADRREDIEGVLKAMAEGLTAIASEDVLTALRDLATALDSILEDLKETSQATKDWRERLGEVAEDIPDLIEQVRQLSTTLQNDLVQALDSAKSKSKEVAESLRALGEAATEAGGVIVEAMDGATESVARFNSEVQSAISLLREMAAAAQEAAAAASSIQLPS